MCHLDPLGDAVTALGFGLVEGAVGLVDQLLDVDCIVGIGGDTKAGGSGGDEAVVGVAQVVGRYRLSDAFGHRSCLLAGHSGKDDAKFLAAPAAYHVGALEVALDGGYGGAENVVAYEVAVVIVVLLEAVEVEHDEGDGGALGLGAAYGCMQLVDEGAMVVRAGEGVTLGLLVDGCVEAGV